jgi:hypothetical protein
VPPSISPGGGNDIKEQQRHCLREARHFRPGAERSPHGRWHRMTRLFLFPGDFICDAFGLVGESEHRQVLRSFFNMMIWGAISIGVALLVAL